MVPTPEPERIFHVTTAPSSRYTARIDSAQLYANNLPRSDDASIFQNIKHNHLIP